MGETSDEEVDYGSPDIDAIPYTDSDHAWSTHGALPGYTKEGVVYSSRTSYQFIKSKTEGGG